MGTLASELQSIAAGISPSPRVYVDANVPIGAVAAMRQDLGWDVLFVLEEPEWRRASDRDHYDRALDLGRTLITLDQDFFDNRRFPPELSPGVIVCSAPDQSGLLRILRHIDRTLLRTALQATLPLRGRKIPLHVDLAAGIERIS
jgi:hypothetical protein